MPSSDTHHVPVRCSDMDDPHRCVASTSRGQCEYLAIPGATFCPIHGGIKCQAVNAANDLYRFRKDAYSNRIAQMKDHPDARKLNTELGLLRMSLEEVVNRIEEPQDLILMYGPQIRELVSDIRATLTANVKLEQTIGTLLTINDVAQLAQALMSVIVEHVTDPVVIATIADEFNKVLATGPVRSADPSASRPA